jgi:hypothetical protein
MRRVNWGDLGLAAGFAVLGLVWIAGASEMTMWDRGTPGPGYLPFVFGALLLPLALLAGAQAVFAPAAPAEGQGGLRKPVLVLLVTAAAVAALEVAGFPLAVFLMLLVLFALVERKPPLASLLASAGVTAALYLIFVVWLSVPLPLGPFGT